MGNPARLVLVAVAGNTSAVVTETLWCLEQQRNLTVSEIRVITTSRGKEAIRRNLWGPEGHFSRYCRDYNVPPGQIAFGEPQVYVLHDDQGRELEDIRDHAGNTAAADYIFSLIQEWTSREDEVLHGSVAGGRKTMGIYLTTAFMLCGRDQDALSHVLVNPRFEAGVRDFFYPPLEPRTYTCSYHTGQPGQLQVVEVPSHEANVELADLPFLRLRDLIGGRSPTEQGYRAALQHSAAISNYLRTPPQLKVCQRCGQVQFGDYGFRLTPQHTAVYIFFLTKFNFLAAPPKASLADIFASRADLDDIERQIARPRDGLLPDEKNAWSKEKDQDDLKQKLGPIITKIKSKIEEALGQNEVARRLAIQIRPRYGVAVPSFKILSRCSSCR